MKAELTHLYNEALVSGEVGHMTVVPTDGELCYCGRRDCFGTDMHIFNGDGGSFAVMPPLIPGHEFSGAAVLIIGGGPIGMIMMQLAKNSGARIKSAGYRRLDNQHRTAG